MRLSDAVETTAFDRRVALARLAATELGPNSTSSKRLVSAIRSENRSILANTDVDGVLSAMLLAAAGQSAGRAWKIRAFVTSRELLVAPSVTSASAITAPGNDYVGADAFNFSIDSVANHAIHLSRSFADDASIAAEVADWNTAVEALTEAGRHFAINPLLTSHIDLLDTRMASPRSFRYRYPLGTAQHLVARLEACGVLPPIRDRELTPWLVANADGGLTSLAGDYSDNVRSWWLALVNSTGNAGTFFGDLWRKVEEGGRVDERMRSLRSLLGDLRDYLTLDPKFSFRATDSHALGTVIQSIAQLNGWDDPVEGGCEDLKAGRWTAHPMRAAKPLPLYKTAANTAGDNRGSMRSGLEGRDVVTELREAANATIAAIEYRQGPQLVWATVLE